MDLKTLGDFLALIAAVVSFLGMGVSYYFYRGQNRSLREHNRLLESRLRVIEQEYNASKESSLLLRQIISKEYDALLIRLKAYRQKLVRYEEISRSLNTRLQSSSQNNLRLKERIAGYDARISELRKRIQSGDEKVSLLQRALKISRELENVVKSDKESSVYAPVSQSSFIAPELSLPEPAKPAGSSAPDASEQKSTHRSRGVFRPPVHIATARRLAESIQKLAVSTAQNAKKDRRSGASESRLFGLLSSAFSLFLDDGYIDPEKRRIKFQAEEQKLLGAIFQASRLVLDNPVFHIAVANFYKFANQRFQAGASVDDFEKLLESGKAVSAARVRQHRDDASHGDYAQEAIIALHNQPLPNPGGERSFRSRPDY